jgi:hypothetical protein
MGENFQMGENGQPNTKKVSTVNDPKGFRKNNIVNLGEIKQIKKGKPNSPFFR